MTPVEVKPNEHSEEQSKEQSGSAIYVFIAIGIFICIFVMFFSLGWVERTDTPPLYKLNLSQPACEAFNRTGFTTEIKNGICTVAVRYRRNHFNEGGTIEEAGTAIMSVGSGQLISLQQLDEGSDEPWTTEHKFAIALQIASFSMMGLMVLAMIFASFIDGKSTMPKKPSDESLHELKLRLAPIIEQDKNNEGAEVIVLKYQWSRLKGIGVKQFRNSLEEFGAQVFVRFPDGREIELLGIGVRENYHPEID